MNLWTVAITLWNKCKAIPEYPSGQENITFSVSYMFSVYGQYHFSKRYNHSVAHIVYLFPTFFTEEKNMKIELSFKSLCKLTKFSVWDSILQPLWRKSWNMLQPLINWDGKAPHGRYKIKSLQCGLYQHVHFDRHRSTENLWVPIVIHCTSSCSFWCSIEIEQHAPSESFIQESHGWSF